LWLFQAKAKFFKVRPSPAKASQSQSKKKGLDFLGFSCPNWAFSMGCADPLGKNSFSSLLPPLPLAGSNRRRDHFIAILCFSQAKASAKEAWICFS
jgi:hypothetical protein